MTDSLRQKMLNRLPAGNRWYSIANKDGPTATVRIYDDIGWYAITEESFARELDEITADHIEVQISSMGGDVFMGIAIYNALRAHPARITTRVDSLAASIASVIVQAGDHRSILSAGQVMIHEAWGLAIGTSTEMRELADILDRQSDIIAGIYAERSGGSVEDFRQLMADETWFTDTQALEAGLIDEIIVPERRSDNSNPIKFQDHLDAVVTDAEKIAARAGEVITFRRDQGKPALTEASVDGLVRVRSAIDALLESSTDTERATPADELRTIELGLVASSQGDI